MAALNLPNHAAILRARLTDIPALLQALGIEVAKRGPGTWHFCCPRHNERTASAHASLVDGVVRVKCFGCDFRGDALELVAAAYGIDNRHDFQRVLQLAAEVAGVTLEGLTGADVAPAKALPRQSARASDAEQRQAIEAFDGAVRQVLDLCPLEGSVGVGMASRGLLEEAQRDGWAELPVDLASADDARAREAAAGFDVADPAASRLVAALARAGLAPRLEWLVRGGRLTSPAHRLLIPWRTRGGRVWMLQRRYAPRYGDEKPSEGAGKYLETPAFKGGRAWPYGIDRFHEEATEVWLVEGAADVLAVRALNRRGLLSADGRPRNLVALGLPGVTAWERCKSVILPLLWNRRLVIALDADDAGDRATGLVLADAADVANACQRKTAPPPFKDWAEVTRDQWRKAHV